MRFDEFNNIFTVVYVFEFVVRFYYHKWEYFKSRMNCVTSERFISKHCALWDLTTFCGDS